MAESLKNKTVKGVAWTSLDQVAGLGFGFVIGVILARLLSPSDYGLLAMITVFNAIAFTFVSSGFGAALVRKPDLTEDDNTTCFCFNFVVAILMTGVLWLIAPLVAKFYDKPILTDLVRVEAFLLIVSALGIVQQTQLSRALNFKAKMIINITSQILADTTATVKMIQIVGLASVEGKPWHNDWLANKRAQALQQYIQERLPVPDSMFETVGGGEAWTELKDIVKDLLDGVGESDLTREQLQQVLTIMENEPRSDAREQSLRALDEDKVYRILTGSLLKDLRNSGYVRVYVEEKQ